jgi:hypothetical protein
LPGKLLEIVLVEDTSIFTILALIKEIVIFPERILLGSALARLR